VVRGSAVNHDGRSSGFTAPNGLAQEAVIRAALADAGLEPAAIGMIEAHGTGTKLGDPIEFDALANVFGGRTAPLLVGSVKTNFGHAEAAAGIAGVIKAALALRRPSIPPHLHFTRLNPHVAANATPIQMPTAPAPWPVDPPRAGISAFGASGTNAHVVLEAPPARPAAPAAEGDGQLLVTGATPEAVRRLGQALAAYLARHAIPFDDACHSMAVGRSRLAWWAIARTPAELERLEPSDRPLPDLPPTRGRRIPLPTYPFARERHWLPDIVEPVATPVLGAPQRIAGTGLTVRTGRLTQDLDWIRDHRVDGSTILPATGFLALCAAAGMSALQDVEILERLDVPADGRDIQLVQTEGGQVELFAQWGDDWRRTCRARPVPLPDAPLAPAALQAADVLDAAGHQDELTKRGFAFGSAFCRIRTLHRGGDLAEAELAAPPAATALQPDPALLDHALQTLTSLLPQEETWLPAAIGGFGWAGGTASHCRARLVRLDREDATGEAWLLGPDGQTVAWFSRLRFRRIGSRHWNWLHELRWRPTPDDLALPCPGWHVLTRGPSQVPEDAAGVIDLRPMTAADPRSCLRETAELVRSLAGRAHPPRLLLVSRGAAAAPPVLPAEPPAAAILAGLVATIAAEHPELRCTWLDLDPAEDRLPDRLLSDHPCLALRGGTPYLPELHRLPPSMDGAHHLRAGTAGRLEALELAPSEPRPPGEGEVQVRILASGLNFKDTLTALGRVAGDALGLEAAGEVILVGAGVQDLAPGDRVLLFASGAHASQLTLPASRCIRLPDGLLPEAAATLPIAFLTAWHGLIELAQLQPGQRVLIHAGAGGVGMAAIQLARWRGARIFATTSPGKQAWARRLGAEATASSRDTSFVAAVREWSGGADIDLVLHAFGSATAAASAGLLREGGSFIELGNAPAPALPPGAQHFSYDLEQPLAADPAWFRSRMGQILDLLAAGIIQPLPRSEAGPAAAGEAFAALAQGRTVGKTVLVWPGHRIQGGTWLVTGGTGAVGSALARMLRGQGATRIVLAGRRPQPESDFETVALDIGDRAAVACLLDDLPDLRGVVHAAGVVQDAPLARLDDAGIAATFHAKLEGARHLDALTRHRQLDAFVLVSSTVAHTGAAGQAAYAAANAWLEGLARARRTSGLPATVLAFGPWQGGMFAALTPLHRDRLLATGYRAMPPDAAAAAALVALAEGGGLTLVMDRQDERPAERAPAATGLRARLEEAPADGRIDLLTGALGEMACRLLGFAEGTRLDRGRALRELGLDSLLAVSFRNELAQALGLDLPASLAFDYPTLEALASHLDGLLFPESDELDRLVEDDLAALLASELETPA
uniref:SDR family NAD(P)-dependent oxidoreductase n=1 Tax=Geminicoccus flavidas TaxID=2506407 RepID=UPI001356B0A4